MENSKHPQERSIAALVHGRYLLQGGRAQDRPRLLVGFHGYGDRAESQLEQLNKIPGSAEWLICSVQSLHLFYNTKTEAVIGSWMTRQGREQMISDNVRYVAAVLAEVNRERGPAESLVFAGFSQGAAMAYRAAAHCGFPCDGLVALAGDVPPELAAEPKLRLPPTLVGRGTQDAWYTEEKMAADLVVLRQKCPRLETCVFEGGHEWSEPFLQACGEFLQSVKNAPAGGA